MANFLQQLGNTAISSTNQIKSIVKNILDVKNQQTLKKVAKTSSFQNFKSLYMSPEAMVSDLPNRLGIVSKVTNEVSSVNAEDFPPYNRTVAATNLPTRFLGFKQVNDQINHLQNLWRKLTGEIRTKITEWDLSIYLQEYLYNDISEVNMLYKLYEDNPSHYTDDRALTYGILNAAVSHKKFSRWNPTADPDMQSWSPPCSETDLTSILTASPAGVSAPEIEQLVREKVKNEQGYKDTMDLINLNWGTWYPEYWRLFFKSPAVELTEEEQVKQDNEIAQYLMDVKITGGPPEIPESPSQGIEVDSPIFFGRPYGRDLDPGAFDSYFADVTSATPKFPLNASSPVNSNYVYFTPLQGINYAINGWNSSYSGTAIRTMSRNVSDGESVDIEETYAYSSEPLSGRYPSAEGIIKVEEKDRFSLWKTIFGNYLFSNKTLRLDSLSNAGDLASKISSDYPTPLLIVSADKKRVLITSVVRRSRTETSWESVRVKVLWWWVTIRKKITNVVYYYEFNLSSTSLFYIPVGEGSFSPANTNIDTQFPMQIKGLFLDIPARSLSGTSNVVTDGWAATGIPTDMGALIAKAFLTGTWRAQGSSAKTIAPIQALAKDLNSTLLSSAPSTISTLQEVITRAISNQGAFLSVLQNLPTTRQNTPAIRDAYAYFSNPSSMAGLQVLLKNLSSGSLGQLQSSISSIITAEGVAGYTKDNLQNLATSLPVALSALQSPEAKALITHWLNILYEYRFDILKKRLNKRDGSYIRAAMTAYSHSMLASEPEPTVTGKEYISENLIVVHKVTTIPFKEKLNRITTIDERVKTVYVPVIYQDNGEPLRHKAGTYQLCSAEILVEGAPEPVSFYLTFEKDKAPKIIKNVITSVDYGKLLGLIGNPTLSKLEMICGSREVKDWWEIPIPEEMQPLATYYQTELMLLLLQDAEVQKGISAVLSGSKEQSSPIYDSVQNTSPAKALLK